MKQIILYLKRVLLILQAIFVAAAFIIDATGFKLTKMSARFVRCCIVRKSIIKLNLFLRKWFARIARLTLVSVLAISGCNSNNSGESLRVQGKPTPQVAKNNPSPSINKQVGVASWYGPGFHGQETANGETFDQKDLTAAHPSLPMGTTAKVTNLENGKKVQVRINDRGPFIQDRAIDLSSAAANKLGMKKDGTTQVKIETKTKTKINKKTKKKHFAKYKRKKIEIKK
jgi:rare lipoprotein A